MRKIFVSVAKFLGLLDVAQCINSTAAGSMINRIERDVHDLEESATEAISLSQKQVDKASKISREANDLYQEKKNKLSEKHAKTVDKLSTRHKKAVSKAYNKTKSALDKTRNKRSSELSKSNSMKIKAKEYTDIAEKSTAVASKLSNLLK